MKSRGDVKISHDLHSVDATSNFGILIMKCMQCLLNECRLRDPAIFVVAIGIPLALEEKNENICNIRIQKEATEILRKLFIDTPHHFSRVLYQLCIPSNQASSDLQLQQDLSPVDSAVSILLDSRMDRNQRLQLVKAVIKIAQREDSLKNKVRIYCTVYNCCLWIIKFKYCLISNLAIWSWAGAYRRSYQVHSIT